MSMLLEREANPQVTPESDPQVTYRLLKLLYNELESLRQQVYRLELGLGPRPVFTAPFAVVDQNGDPLFEVEQVDGETRIFIYAPGKALPRVVLAADTQGGGVGTFNAVGEPMVAAAGFLAG